MAVAVMFITMFLFMAIGVPLGVCLIAPCFLMLAIDPVTSQEFLAQTFYSGTASFSMIAIPFFMICGDIMNLGGISKRLVKLANACFGRITGSLGYVAILACMFFGAVSGSAVATVAAIGGIMIPEMVREGYDKYYAAALCGCAGGLGIIVPPSYPLVIYGITVNESIGDLFLAGTVPAVLIGVALMLVNFFYCKKHNIRGHEKFAIKNVGKAFIDSILALLMPIIILGGIYSGIFSATESAVVATAYGIILAVFVYKEVSFADLWKMYKNTATFSSGMMLTVAPATAVGTIFAYLGVTAAINGFFMSITSSKYIVMIIMVGILFLIGMFLQTTPAIVIFGPVLLNVVKQYGISPLQFGIIMDIALAIGFCTPPVCANMFVAQSLTGLPLLKIVKKAIPFIIALILCLLLVACFPQISSGIVTMIRSK
ncbi:MAG: TRAP transporter large permease [Clostridia bacterium]|nr:TRAP transporter large permease [Clostridia bacterium]